MTIEEKIFALWSAEPTAVALVPAARFKPAGIYQNLATPYCFNFPVAEAPERTHAGIVPLSGFLWQFSIVVSQDNAAQAESIIDKMLSVYDGNKQGFNFHFRGRRFVTADAETSTLLYAADFFVTPG